MTMFNYCLSVLVALLCHYLLFQLSKTKMAKSGHGINSKFNIVARLTRPSVVSICIIFPGFPLYDYEKGKQSYSFDWKIGAG